MRLALSSELTCRPVFAWSAVNKGMCHHCPAVVLFGPGCLSLPGALLCVLLADLELRDLPGSASQMLGLNVCIIKPSFM